MGQKLTARHANLSYFWNRVFIPFWGQLWTPLSIGVIVWLMLKSNPTPVVQGTVFTLIDGQLRIVSEADDAEVQKWVDKKAQALGDALAQYTKNETGTLKARLDEFYPLMGGSAKARYATLAREAMERAKIESAKLLGSKVEAKFVEKGTQGWSVIYIAKVLVEDESRRQTLRRLTMGLEMNSISPTKNYPHLGQIQSIEFDLANVETAQKAEEGGPK